MPYQPLLRRFLVWRQKHIKHKQFVLILSILVGLASGIVAMLIKNSVHFIQYLLAKGSQFEYYEYLFLIFPLVGILITVTIIRFVIRRPVRAGIPNTLYAISKQNGNIPKHNAFSSIITSAFTVGFGGSSGLEAPTVITSAAVGSNIGSIARMNYKTKTLLIGCAAAGSLAAIFNAPIAAIVFAIEVIMLDLTTALLIPLLLASISATITSKLLIGDDVLFHFDLHDQFLIRDLPFYIMLGIVTGLLSMYFTKIYFFTVRSFEKLKKKYHRALIGGLMVGILIFVFPSLAGEGYDAINALINGDSSKIVENTVFQHLENNTYFIVLFLLAIVLFKVIATAVTLGSGGVGGVFAPSLFIGSTLGFTFANIFNQLGWKDLSESNFTLVGMAGMMAGVLHAPLTAIFLIAEITGGYELFIPLMTTAAISFITVKLFLPHSLYTRELAKRGELITHHKDQAVLTLMKLESEIEKDFAVVNPDQTLGDMVKIVARSSRNLFPVVDEDGILLGVVTLDDIRHLMFDQEHYDTTHVEELMNVPDEFISIEENMDAVMQKFEQTGAWNLPVVRDGKYEGFVSKSKLFNAYRKLLVEFSEE
jgi:CIC family chloride channel protein